MPIIPPPSPHEARYAPPTLSLAELLKKISYKPGWKIKIEEDYPAACIDVILIYEGYESQNAAFDPVCLESGAVTRGREIWAKALGKTVRQEQRYCFRKRFETFFLQQMKPEDIIRYVIANTIKEAEMYEFDRWFKFEGVPIFENKEQSRT